MASEVIKKTKLKSCFMHFEDVCETLFPITKARLEKFVESRQQWVSFKCEQAEVCQMSYEAFSDEDILSYLNEDVFELDWPYKTCYKRLCDVNKFKAEKSAATLVEKLVTKTVTAGEKRKSSRLLAENDQKVGCRKRPRNVLPGLCIIVQKQSH